VEFVDICVGRIMQAVEKVGGVSLVLADHGNCEQMAMFLAGFVIAKLLWQLSCVSAATTPPWSASGISATAIQASCRGGMASTCSSGTPVVASTILR
jgi:hypothetical protein